MMSPGGGGENSSSSSSSRDGQRDSNSQLLENANRTLRETVSSLSTEVHKLGQKNEELQEQIEVSEISWSHEQQKREASWDDERAHYVYAVHEWLQMEHE